MRWLGGFKRFPAARTGADDAQLQMRTSLVQLKTRLIQAARVGRRNHRPADLAAGFQAGQFVLDQDFTGGLQSNTAAHRFCLSLVHGAQVQNGMRKRRISGKVDDISVSRRILQLAVDHQRPGAEAGGDGSALVGVGVRLQLDGTVVAQVVADADRAGTHDLGGHGVGADAPVVHLPGAVVQDDLRGATQGGRVADEEAAGHHLDAADLVVGVAQPDLAVLADGLLDQVVVVIAGEGVVVGVADDQLAGAELDGGIDGQVVGVHPATLAAPWGTDHAGGGTGGQLHLTAAGDIQPAKLERPVAVRAVAPTGQPAAVAEDQVGVLQVGPPAAAVAGHHVVGGAGTRQVGVGAVPHAAILPQHQHRTLLHGQLAHQRGVSQVDAAACLAAPVVPVERMQHAAGLDGQIAQVGHVDVQTHVGAILDGDGRAGQGVAGVEVQHAALDVQGLAHQGVADLDVRPAGAVLLDGGEAATGGAADDEVALAVEVHVAGGGIQLAAPEVNPAAALGVEVQAGRAVGILGHRTGDGHVGTVDAVVEGGEATIDAVHAVVAEDVVTAAGAVVALVQTEDAVAAGEGLDLGIGRLGGDVAEDGTGLQEDVLLGATVVEHRVPVGLVDGAAGLDGHGLGLGGLEFEHAAGIHHHLGDIVQAAVGVGHQPAAADAVGAGGDVHAAGAQGIDVLDVAHAVEEVEAAREQPRPLQVQVTTALVLGELVAVAVVGDGTGDIQLTITEAAGLPEAHVAVHDELAVQVAVGVARHAGTRGTVEQVAGQLAAGLHGHVGGAVGLQRQRAAGVDVQGGHGLGLVAVDDQPAAVQDLEALAGTLAQCPVGVHVQLARLDDPVAAEGGRVVADQSHGLAVQLHGDGAGADDGGADGVDVIAIAGRAAEAHAAGTDVDGTAEVIVIAPVVHAVGAAVDVEHQVAGGHTHTDLTAGIDVDLKRGGVGLDRLEGQDGPVVDVDRAGAQGLVGLHANGGITVVGVVRPQLPAAGEVRAGGAQAQRPAVGVHRELAGAVDLSQQPELVVTEVAAIRVPDGRVRGDGDGAGDVGVVVLPDL